MRVQPKQVGLSQRARNAVQSTHASRVYTLCHVRLRWRSWPGSRQSQLSRNVPPPRHRAVPRDRALGL